MRNLVPHISFQIICYTKQIRTMPRMFLIYKERMMNRNICHIQISNLIGYDLMFHKEISLTQNCNLSMWFAETRCMTNRTIRSYKFFTVHHHPELLSNGMLFWSNNSITFLGKGILYCFLKNGLCVVIIT